MNRLLSSFTLAAVLSLGLGAGVALASGYEDTIRTAYVAAGYSDIEVHQVNGQWLVTATMNGTAYHFIVDATTGQSTQVSDDSPEAQMFDDDGSDDMDGDDDGAGHDAGDDNGADGAGHDAGDDHGTDGANHDAGDDHGGDKGGKGSDD